MVVFLKWHQNGTKAKTGNPKRLDFIEFLLVEHTGLELVWVCSHVNKVSVK